MGMSGSKSKIVIGLLSVIIILSLGCVAYLAFFKDPNETQDKKIEKKGTSKGTAKNSTKSDFNFEVYVMFHKDQKETQDEKIEETGTSKETAKESANNDSKSQEQSKNDSTENKSKNNSTETNSENESTETDSKNDPKPVAIPPQAAKIDTVNPKKLASITEEVKAEKSAE